MGLFRLFLAVSVLENHLAERIAGPGNYGLGLIYGDQAVEIFFIISGFYMALVLHEKYNRPGDYINFIQQRFLRLYPTYLLVLVLIVAAYLVHFAVTSRMLGTLAHYRDYFHIQSPFTLALYGLCNLVVLGQDWLYLFHQDIGTGQFYAGMPPAGTVSIWCMAFFFNPPSWSLSAEFTFYFLAPFLIRWSIRAQVALLIACVALRYGFLLSGIEDVHSWLTFFFPSDLGFFMAGAIAYRFYRRHRDRLSALTANRWWIWCLLGTPLLFYRRLPEAHEFDVVLITLCAVLVPLLFAFTRNNRVDRLIGELSYPFYLIHWTVMVMLDAAMGEASPFLEPACILVTLACAYLTYWFFERRIDEWRAWLFRQKRQSA